MYHFNLLLISWALFDKAVTGTNGKRLMIYLPSAKFMLWIKSLVLWDTFTDDIIMLAETMWKRVGGAAYPALQTTRTQFFKVSLA